MTESVGGVGKREGGRGRGGREGGGDGDHNDHGVGVGVYGGGKSINERPLSLDGEARPTTSKSLPFKSPGVFLTK